MRTKEDMIDEVWESTPVGAVEFDTTATVNGAEGTDVKVRGPSDDGLVDAWVLGSDGAAGRELAPQEMCLGEWYRLTSVAEDAAWQRWLSLYGEGPR